MPYYLLDVKENDKDNIKVIGIKDGSKELNGQTKLKKHLVFLANNLLLNNSIIKKTDSEDYFLFVSVIASNNNSEKSNINVMEMNDLPN